MKLQHIVKIDTEVIALIYLFLCQAMKLRFFSGNEELCELISQFLEHWFPFKLWATKRFNMKLVAFCVFYSSGFFIKIAIIIFHIGYLMLQFIILIDDLLSIRIIILLCTIHLRNSLRRVVASEHRFSSLLTVRFKILRVSCNFCHLFLYFIKF